MRVPAAGAMKMIKCSACGADEFLTIPGYQICKYCHAKYQLTKEDMLVKDSVISIRKDVETLLKKCRDNPAKAKKYANLVLDIDPNNKEALKYIK